MKNSIEKQNQQVNIIDLKWRWNYFFYQNCECLNGRPSSSYDADRANDKKYHKKLDFFNKKAGFNKNPFQIAYKLKKSILVFFVVYTKKQTYRIKHLKIELDYSKKEDLAVEIAMKEYINIFRKNFKRVSKSMVQFLQFWENRWN